MIYGILICFYASSSACDLLEYTKREDVTYNAVYLGWQGTYSKSTHQWLRPLQPRLLRTLTTTQSETRLGFRIFTGGLVMVVSFNIG